MRTKLLALACCLMAAFTAQAQDSLPVSSPEKTFKPTAGDITTEVGLNLNHGISLNSGQLRARKFTAKDRALRLGTSIDYTYYRRDAQVSSKTFGISLAPGIEKHFRSTNRLSPYIGAELPIGFRTSMFETENYTVKGATAYETIYNRANFNIGLNGLAGVDYYFAPRFYVGFEVGAGLTYIKYRDVEWTSKNDSPYIPEDEVGFHSIKFSPFSTGGIRLGFAF